ncbi:MAG: hypothetical protein AAF607_14100, partial [Pseudomonadota bacterium]
AAALLAITSANAATSFTDRSAFIAQTSPQGAIDFENAQAGSSFAGQDLTVGNMALSGGVDDFFTLNLIAPAGSCIGFNLSFFQIDGSQFACSFVDPEADLRIDFNAPVTAWGADFRDIADDDRRTKLSFYDDDDALLADYVAEGFNEADQSFIGLDFMGAEASYLIFSFITGPQDISNSDVFGMDNVLFSTARGMTPNPVPVPPAMLLFASAGAVFAGLGKARSAKSAH